MEDEKKIIKEINKKLINLDIDNLLLINEITEKFTKLSN
jgi:hypothetical protein